MTFLHECSDEAIYAKRRANKKRNTKTASYHHQISTATRRWALISNKRHRGVKKTQRNTNKLINSRQAREPHTYAFGGFTIALALSLGLSSQASKTSKNTRADPKYRTSHMLEKEFQNMRHCECEYDQKCAIIFLTMRTIRTLSCYAKYEHKQNRAKYPKNKTKQNGQRAEA